MLEGLLQLQIQQLATRRVIAQVTAPTSDALRTEGTRNLERMIRHQRQLVRLEPPVPRTADFEIPNELKTMSDGSPFVLHDSSVDNRDGVEIDGRIIILGSRKTLEMLANATNIGADGSFSRAPPGFMQFYSVHANNDKKLRIRFKETS
uniref:Uncharacterized protein n=1 Tax=Panagrolaimus superbus TaxID=310955 RepID=A0A914XY18_9BILA